MPETLARALREQGIRLHEKELLSKWTTVCVGGPARLMAFPRNTTQLQTILEVLRALTPDLDWVVLGGGANFFADSAGFSGLIVSMTEWDEEWQLAPRGESAELVVPAGARLVDVAERAADEGWCGINFMAEIPGTVGGAVVINAGTNVGGYVADTFTWAEAVLADGTVRRYHADEMDFAYRRSNLLHGNAIIMRAAFTLQSCASQKINPHDLRQQFAAIRQERGEKFPLEHPNFGSTWRSPGAPHPPAGKIIDDLGLKGLTVGGAEISQRHGNFILNTHNATSSDIIALMQRTHESVHEALGVSLQPEVHYLRDREARTPAFFPPRQKIL